MAPVALASFDTSTRCASSLTFVMPVMDGYRLLEVLRERRPLPAVAMTATLALSDEQQKRLGGAPLLYKPFTLESFVAAIKAARFARRDFTYQIDDEKRIVVMRSTANPTAEERIAMVNRIWAEPAYRHGYAIVIDRRGYEHVPSPRDIDVFHALHRGTRGASPPSSAMGDCGGSAERVALLRGRRAGCGAERRVPPS